MSTDEYVPDEYDLEVAWIEFEASADDINAASAEFQRGLARVRQDAEAELDSWMTRAYEAEKRAWQAERRIARLEAQTDIRGRAVVIYRERARQAEAERDEWRQTALDERGAALDALEQIKAREARIAAVDAELLYAELHGNPEVWTHDIRRALEG